jgi:RimJ/RimL family protein N-acetyltransferase
MRKMIAYLCAHGTRRIVADVLQENGAMRELARANGFSVDAATSDSFSLRFVLSLPVPTPV